MEDPDLTNVFVKQTHITHNEYYVWIAKQNVFISFLDFTIHHYFLKSILYHMCT